MGWQRDAGSNAPSALHDLACNRKPAFFAGGEVAGARYATIDRTAWEREAMKRPKRCAGNSIHR